MRRSKWIIIVLVALMGLCIVACGNDDEDEDSRKPTEPGSTNIVTPTNTLSPTLTNALTPTPTNSLIPTPTNSPTPTPADTPTPTSTNTPTPTPTNSPTPELVKNPQVGQYVKFGTYEQDNNLDNGKEPIEWEVLAVDGDNVLLISRYILDCVPYNEEKMNVTWETSSLRRWLNSDFYNIAFSSKEQERIQIVTLVNEDNQRLGTIGGNDTCDQVFCLSLSEIKKYYSFNSWDKESFCGYSEELLIPTTDYIRNTVWNAKFTSAQYEGYGYEKKGYSKNVIGTEGTVWWLRSPGYFQNAACCVDLFGYVGAYHSYDVEAAIIGVRPAIWVSTEPGLAIVATPTNTLSPTPTNTPIPTNTPSPTNTPTPTPVTSVSVSDVMVFETAVPDSDKAWIQKLYGTHIEPFLNGYEIEEMEVAAFPNTYFGYQDYKIVCVFEKNGVEMGIGFHAFAKLYNNDVVEDDIFFEWIVFTENWEVIAEYENVSGLKNYINNVEQTQNQ